MKTKSESTVYRYSSLKHFSWDSKKEISLDEKLVQSTILEWYDAKHRSVSKEEKEFGYHGLKLYKVAKGIRIILGHTKEKITIPGRIRKKKEDPITLF